MICWVRLIKAVVFVWCSLSLSAQAKMLDVYFQSKMPADWLAQPPKQTESLELRLMRLIFANSPDIRPHFLMVNYTKASELTRLQPDSCMASILKNPQREAQFLFSRPFSVIEGLKLYIPKHSAWHERLKPKLKQWGGNIRLSELLLTEIDFVLGLDLERSYGAELDLLFKEQAVSRSLYRKQSGARIAELWPMVQQNRVSAVLEYPFMLATTDATLLQSYTVAEAEPLQLAYFACNKSDRGQAIIDKLNASIETLAGTQAYLDLHLEAVPEERKADFTQLYQGTILSN